MKLMRGFGLFLLLSLLGGQSTFAADWDGKSPMWVGGVACTEKIKFFLMDKMSVYETYEVEYRVNFDVEDRVQYVSTRHSSSHDSTEAIFPDDFYDFNLKVKSGEFMEAPSPCLASKIFWSTFVNGKKISAGVITNQVTQFEVNGKLISIKRK